MCVCVRACLCFCALYVSICVWGIYIWRVDSITPLALCEGATTTPRTTAPAATTTTTSTVAPATTSKETLTTTKRLTTTKKNSRGVSLWVFACQPAKDSHKNTIIPDTTAITYAQKPINTRRSGPASAFQGRRGTAKSLHFVATTMFKRRPTAQINAMSTRNVAATPGTTQIKCAYCTTTPQLRAPNKKAWCVFSRRLHLPQRPRVRLHLAPLPTQQRC